MPVDDLWLQNLQMTENLDIENKKQEPSTLCWDLGMTKLYMYMFLVPLQFSQW